MTMLAIILLSMTLHGRSYARDLASSMAAEGFINAGLNQSLIAAPPRGKLLNRNDWIVICDSACTDHECTNAIDGDRNTFWHSEYLPEADGFPHTITIDMKTVQIVNGISVLPRQDGWESGFIAGHEIYISQDGRNFGEPVAFGTWFADKAEKISAFEPVKARYVRLIHTTEPQNQPHTTIAEINVYTAASYTAPQPNHGVWGPTIDAPIVPAAAAILPDGKVLMWSSYAKDAFAGSPRGFTLTAIYNPSDKTISQRTVSNTQHDMFCPGLSIDANGRVIVTGGQDAPQTSIYDPEADSWIAAEEMNISRGYQSSAICSDGGIFTIGGSWNGGNGSKIGEKYDTITDSWTVLPGCPVEPIETADKAGVYRADNHAMLFGWKGNTVFQAGPSGAMNWYDTNGEGSQKAAGMRGNDTDAMCGIAVMYDAVAGKILTAGGSPHYDNTAATTNAYLITIEEPNVNPTVRMAGNNMKYPRIFHSAVVLPDGEVFICGGQSIGWLFQDTGYQNVSEIYSPKTDEFRPGAVNSIPRTYHSVALLMQDATVICGGGGLCGKCSTNHFDFQIYSPSYLFNGDGSKATRPTIISVSTTTVKPGGRLDFKTDRKIISASLVRLGSDTHTINTDQRRIPLDLKVAGVNAYLVKLPEDSGILLPGYWFLFAMNEHGTPSVGKTIKITLPHGFTRVEKNTINNSHETPRYFKV